MVMKNKHVRDAAPSCPGEYRTFYSLRVVRDGGGGGRKPTVILMFFTVFTVMIMMLFHYLLIFNDKIYANLKLIELRIRDYPILV